MSASLTGTLMGVIIGLACGLLAGQFFIQAILSLATSLTYVSGLFLSLVHKSNNVIGAGVAFAQSIVFAALAYGIWWLTSEYVAFWNSDTIAGTLAFLFSILFSFAQ